MADNERNSFLSDNLHVRRRLLNVQDESSKTHSNDLTPSKGSFTSQDNGAAMAEDKSTSKSRKGKPSQRSSKGSSKTSTGMAEEFGLSGTADGKQVNNIQGTQLNTIPMTNGNTKARSSSRKSSKRSRRRSKKKSRRRSRNKTNKSKKKNKKASNDITDSTLDGTSAKSVPAENPNGGMKLSSDRELNIQDAFRVDQGTIEPAVLTQQIENEKSEFIPASNSDKKSLSEVSEITPLKTQDNYPFQTNEITTTAISKDSTINSNLGFEYQQADLSMNQPAIEHTATLPSEMNSEVDTVIAKRKSKDQSVASTSGLSMETTHIDSEPFIIQHISSASGTGFNNAAFQKSPDTEMKSQFPFHANTVIKDNLQVNFKPSEINKAGHNIIETDSDTNPRNIHTDKSTRRNEQPTLGLISDEQAMSNGGIANNRDFIGFVPVDVGESQHDITGSTLNNEHRPVNDNLMESTLSNSEAGHREGQMTVTSLDPIADTTQILSRIPAVEDNVDPPTLESSSHLTGATLKNDPSVINNRTGDVAEPNSKTVITEGQIAVTPLKSVSMAPHDGSSIPVAEESIKTPTLVPTTPNDVSKLFRRGPIAIASFLAQMLPEILGSGNIIFQTRGPGRTVFSTEGSFIPRRESQTNPRQRVPTVPQQGSSVFSRPEGSFLPRQEGAVILRQTGSLIPRPMLSRLLITSRPRPRLILVHPRNLSFFRKRALCSETPRRLRQGCKNKEECSYQMECYLGRCCATSDRHAEVLEKITERERRRRRLRIVG
ncbi:serine-rich adhesin for platelets-like [Argopecten irradians]|uniref:serine-rich adhesin for platelets-like n=1 Tax=Argopecten irradians TaxID=31199 RepID=UPI003718CC56